MAVGKLRSVDPDNIFEGIRGQIKYRDMPKRVCYGVASFTVRLCGEVHSKIKYRETG